MGGVNSAAWLFERTAPAVVAAGRVFSHRTGTGCDNLPPRVFANLSDEGDAALRVFFEEVERTGIWPVHLSTNVLYLLPKAEG